MAPRRGLERANPFLWHLIGDCHRQLGQDAVARDSYRVALSCKPDYRPALAALRSMTLWGRLADRLSRLLWPDKQ